MYNYSIFFKDRCLTNELLFLVSQILIHNWHTDKDDEMVIFRMRSRQVRLCLLQMLAVCVQLIFGAFNDLCIEYMGNLCFGKCYVIHCCLWTVQTIHFP